VIICLRSAVILSLSRWTEYFVCSERTQKIATTAKSLLVTLVAVKCSVPSLFMWGHRTCDSGQKCACEFPPTEREREYLSRGFAFRILLCSVTSDSTMTFHCKTIFLLGGRDCVKRSKISQNFCTHNLVLVTQRVTACVSSFIVNRNSWRNGIPEHNH